MDECQFNILRELTKDRTLSQRELSRRVGISLGRVNSVVKALLEKCYIKVKRFKNSKNKIAYRYVLTPKGISAQTAQTYGFLKKKQDEFERLKQEIEVLRRETDVIDRRKNGRRQKMRHAERKKWDPIHEGSHPCCCKGD
ncbi:MAG: MarR family EPS-associated transcriptional regulator [Thermodesulfovibrionales bacterium]|jgi:EPS-associated MarR family transcriptional regulator